MLTWDVKQQNKQNYKGTTLNSAGIVRDRTARDDIIRRLENDPRYKSLLPPSRGHEAGQQDDDDEDTFTTLRNMVEETAKLARAAVGASPGRAKSMLESMESAPAQRRYWAIFFLHLSWPQISRESSIKISTYLISQLEYAVGTRWK